MLKGCLGCHYHAPVGKNLHMATLPGIISEAWEKPQPMVGLALENRAIPKRAFQRMHLSKGKPYFLYLTFYLEGDSVRRIM